MEADLNKVDEMTFGGEKGGQMLAILFGAGASFDGFPTFPINSDRRDLGEARMPLADQLFENREYFEKVRATFEACLPLIPTLQSRIKGQSVEQALENLQSEAETSDKRGRIVTRQLAALRAYFQDIIWHCETECMRQADNVTNHHTLLDLVEKNRPEDETVCLITF